MTIEESNEHLYDIVAQYFSRANVVWAQEFMTTPKYPLVTLKTKNLDIGNMSIDYEVYGEHASAYNITYTLEVNLYTKGEDVEDEAGEVFAMDNTALSDLMQFVVFTHSPFIQNTINKIDMCILLKGKVQDVSSLLKDNKYEYRAMCEFNISFVTNFVGAYNTIKKTASGGGDDDLINAKTGWFEEAEIENFKEESSK